MSNPTFNILSYSATKHVRRHGPAGYDDYRSFKPWLRDEFHFRCVFCLLRERWVPDGEAAFSVEHFVPKSRDSALVCEYHNLYLACCGCNAAKNDCQVALDPCEEAFGRHLSVDDDGTIIGKTPEGCELIDICHINRPKLREFRLRIVALWSHFHELGQNTNLLSQFFGYPEDLPDLSSLRPKGGNRMQGSENGSAFHRRMRGELEDVYR